MTKTQVEVITAATIPARRAPQPCIAPRVYEREGIDLDVSTLADWVGAAAAALMPLVNVIAPTSSPPSAFMPTTPQYRSWPRARPASADYGPMYAMTARSPARSAGGGVLLFA
jgi:hypothetical protein